MCLIFYEIKTRIISHFARLKLKFWFYYFITFWNSIMPINVNGMIIRLSWLRTHIHEEREKKFTSVYYENIIVKSKRRIHICVTLTNIFEKCFHMCSTLISQHESKLMRKCMFCVSCMKSSTENANYNVQNFCNSPWSKYIHTYIHVQIETCLIPYSIPYSTWHNVS